jgi:beta-1,4-mannosyl-glycoprotein beta-1,4-N-acetylglucosaminyltransferase
MAIYDGFIFFNELDLLDIRLRELEAVVDRFVLVEAPVTFSGRPKPLYFADGIDRFARWRDRITHVVVDDMPAGPDPWRREQHQRNAILRGLSDAAPGDGVIISDCDEIPAADAVRRWPGDARVFDQLFSYYWINCVGGGWSGSRIVPMRQLQSLGGPHAVRHTVFPGLTDGGWHFSYAGGRQRITEKLAAYSHTELNDARFTNQRHLTLALAFGMDLFDRAGHGWRLTPLDARFPAAVHADRDRFGHLVCDAMFHECWYSNEQLAWLSAAVDRVAGLRGALVEIGCWEGRSTIAIANACHPEPVVAIDSWLGNRDEHPDHPTVALAQARDLFGQFQINVRALTQGNVVVMRRDCHAALADWTGPIKFAHIDGSHDYHSVGRSIDACRRFLVPGGVVCGADFLTADLSRADLDGGVERAVRELLPGFELNHSFWSWTRPREA